MMYNALLLLLSRPHMTFLKLSQPTIKAKQAKCQTLASAYRCWRREFLD